MNTARTSSEVRKTKETDIQLDLNIDGSGVYEVDTGIMSMQRKMALS